MCSAELPDNWNELSKCVHDAVSFQQSVTFFNSFVQGTPDEVINMLPGTPPLELGSSISTPEKQVL